jgi:hypothetical protein
MLFTQLPLFNFVFECFIRMVQEHQGGLKLNGTHQLLSYSGDVNLLDDNTNINSVALSPRANYTD